MVYHPPTQSEQKQPVTVKTDLLVKLVLMVLVLSCIAEEDQPESFEKRRRVFDWPEASMVELQRLHQWVVQTKGYKPLIIDADDLQMDPGQ